MCFSPKQAEVTTNPSPFPLAEAYKGFEFSRSDGVGDVTKAPGTDAQVPDTSSKIPVVKQDAGFYDLSM